MILFELFVQMRYEMGNLKKKNRTSPKTCCFSTRISRRSEKVWRYWNFPKDVKFLFKKFVVVGSVNKSSQTVFSVDPIYPRKIERSIYD